MARHLDLSSLRSFVAVAEAGGVTRAATQLNLTQSAVSMQLKRMEEALGHPLLDRSGRTVALTAHGELLLGYGRRLLALNDEAWGRMTHDDFKGELNFGLPHDVIHPHVPGVLRRFAGEFPRVKVQLHSRYTSELKQDLARGEMDLIMTTEAELDPGGLNLAVHPLVWVGAVGGQIWRRRPVRFASISRCMFRKPAFDALEREGVPCEIAVDSESMTAIDATVAADLAIYVQLAGAINQHHEVIRHGGALPELPNYMVNLYVGQGPRAAIAGKLAELICAAYCTSDRVPEAVAAE
jgi:DNA-binding transcriptional LysR family regulator